ncbi:GNAT family N-acetyltransferase [Ulvibacter litoralis]|uniref:ElaA protein n=1 Tax=Ulvibacter litoralis TaxID=227084 RepID=A0A1G7DCF9_9FLAO|nr:GNAT family N-acetyltransferase [Ulvibacter litoralis]GHC44254.1 ElaA protein [Ulvibacter litoralis]SDE48646.1 ElaA protein [Ulvibacter litoralis]
MKITVKTFDQFTIHELHDVFQLRSEVFVVEQHCVYQDIDGKDPKALHVIGTKDGKVVAYTRCFQPGFYFEQASIGRVVVAKETRKFKYGHDIMRASKETIKTHYNTTHIKISAQTYLLKFYQSHGFQQIGEGYLEDGIPHIAMITA